MKYILLFINLIFPSIFLFSQDLSRINLDLKLTDSLSDNFEIRIYRCGSFGNSSVLRIFSTHNDSSQAELYNHSQGTAGDYTSKIVKKTLQPKQSIHYLILRLESNFIYDLPSFDAIKWKLEKRTIEEEKYKNKGKEILGHTLTKHKVLILDGEVIIIQYKTFNKANQIKYINPVAFLKSFPNIDELVYMNNILQVIREELGIW